jgi:hypothetical protein
VSSTYPNKMAFPGKLTYGNIFAGLTGGSQAKEVK